MINRREPPPVRVFRRMYNLEGDEEIVDFAWAYTGSFLGAVFNGNGYRTEPDEAEKRLDEELSGFNRGFEFFYWLLLSPLIAIIGLFLPEGRIKGTEISGVSKRGYLFITTKNVVFSSSDSQGRGLLFFSLSAVGEVIVRDRVLTRELTFSLKEYRITRLFYPKGSMDPKSQTFKFFRRSSAVRLIDAGKLIRAARIEKNEQATD